MRNRSSRPEGSQSSRTGGTQGLGHRIPIKGRRRRRRVCISVSTLGAVVDGMFTCGNRHLLVYFLPFICRLLFSTVLPHTYTSLSQPTRDDFHRAHLVQLAVRASHQNGRDTHIRQVKIYGPREYVPCGPFFSILFCLFPFCLFFFSLSYSGYLSSPSIGNCLSLE